MDTPHSNSNSNSCEVTATYEFIIELAKFYNVDLFLRGLYTLQLNLKTNSASNKLNTRIEVTSRPLSSSSSSSTTSTNSRPNTKNKSNPSVNSDPNLLPPPLPPNNQTNHHGNKKQDSPSQQSNSSTTSNSCSSTSTIAKSRTIRILFKNEEIDLNQIILYRVNINLDIKNLQDLLNILEFRLELKLLFNESIVSTRDVIINLYQGVGVNYYRPVFFDYFYLCAVGIGVHGGLIALHLTKGLSASDYYLAFSNGAGAGCGSGGGSGTPSCVSTSSSGSSSINNSRLRTSQQLLLQILINANTNLRSKLSQLMKKESSCCLNLAKPSMNVVNQFGKGKGVGGSGGRGEEDTSSDEETSWIQNSKQMSQLCAENILVWHKFLDTVIGKEDVRNYLARLHHQARVERFTEGFYITKNPLRAALVPKDYTPIVELLKKSIIYKPLPLECLELDGDENSIPIIFEDQYVKSVCNCLGGGTVAMGVAMDQHHHHGGHQQQSTMATATTTTLENYKKPPFLERDLPLDVVIDERKFSMATAKATSSSSSSASCIVGSRLTISKSTIEIVGSSSSVPMETAGKGLPVLSGKSQSELPTPSDLISSVTTLPRRHSEYSSGGGNKRITKPPAFRRYASTPLLNDLELDDLQSEESGCWVSGEDDVGSLSSNNSGSSDGHHGDVECNDVATTTKSSDKKKKSADVVKATATAEVSTAEVYLSMVPPPIEFRDPPPLSNSGDAMTTSLNSQFDLVSMDSQLQQQSRHSRKYGSLQYPNTTSNLKREQLRKLSDESQSTTTRMSTRSNEILIGSHGSKKSTSPLQQQQQQQQLSTTSQNLPYYFFQIPDELRIFHPSGLHLVICVHGLDGSSHDLRLLKIYLEVSLPGSNLHFLMSEKNQDGETFNNFESMTNSFVQEVINYIKCNKLNPSRVSFIGHSLGNIIVRGAVQRREFQPLLTKLHTFLSLSGPHLGSAYNGSGIVNVGMWLMQKWKKSNSLLQLQLKDSSNIQSTYLYKLSLNSNLQHFKNVLLCGSSQDRYVPLHSAHIINCKQSLKDSSVLGIGYRQMISNILNPVLKSSSCNLVRYDVHHCIAGHSANSIIGRAAHIAVLDSEIFIEKFLSVSGGRYFQ